jgi:membrane-bound serine protease (ClpP class)
VHVITLDEKTINPVTAEYIQEGITRAETSKAQYLIIELDTPGGLLNSTRSIVKSILSASIPVIVYVSPRGSRAASAGVFITYASHIAAMAPSTNIGAAHPVSFGGRQPAPKESEEWKQLKKVLPNIADDDHESQEIHDDQDDDAERMPVDADTQSDHPSTPLEDKIKNDTIAFIKALARFRGRNEEWALESVVNSESITDQEAIEKGVIEILADDISDLLRQLDGREISVNGTTSILQTRDAPILRFAMNTKQKFFNVLADPNIAYFLLILGFYALLFEVTNPGIGVPGVLGAIFLILAFYSLQTLPTNYAGLALMGLGGILLVAEFYVPGFGLLTLGGLVCLILGSLLLFDSVDPLMRVSYWVIGIMSLSLASGMIFVTGILLKNRHRPVHGGKEGMIGQTGNVLSDINPNHDGFVFVHGERWIASADETIKTGQKITVESIQGLKLTVTLINKQP